MVAVSNTATIVFIKNGPAGHGQQKVFDVQLICKINFGQEIYIYASQN